MPARRRIPAARSRAGRAISAQALSRTISVSSSGGSPPTRARRSPRCRRRREADMSSLQTNDLRTVVEPSLRGRVAIVTGAGQGLGRVFAKAFALAGATAVIAERNHDKGRAVAAEIGNAAFAIHTDVADPASIDGMVAEVDRRFGRVDILVNNAGIFSTLEMRPFEQIPLDEWEQVLRVNVTGPFLCARAVLPAMRRAKWGRIINMASGAVTGPAELPALHHLEGSARRHDTVDGARARRRWHHRQLDPAGRHLHRDRAQDRLAGAEAAHRGAAVHPAAGGAGGPGRHRAVPGVGGVGLRHRPGPDRGRRLYPPLNPRRA